MLRRLTLAVVFFVCLGIIIPSVPVLNFALAPIIGVEQAQAQEKRKRKTLFDVLFKQRKKNKNKIKVVKPSKKTASRKLKKKKKSSQRKTARAASQIKPAVIAVKNENASKILVVGDFLAGGMGRELTKLICCQCKCCCGQ